jgi:pimeloyl-ACP methyl ester carboxylesterase
MSASRMSRTLSIALFAAAAVLATGPDKAEAGEAKASTPAEASAVSKPVKKGRVDVNGLSYYYEIHGRGEPLLLLHGGLGQIEMFGPVLSILAAQRQVIGVDLQGHGRTTLGTRELSVIDMGNDMAGILKKLGYEKVDAMGYSLGAGVAFRFAVQNPAMVRKLVLVSGAYSQEGFYPELLPMQAQVNAGAAEAMKGTPMYESYVKVAPNPGDFPKLLDRIGELMRKSYDWSEDVKQLKMPVMLVWGDSDMFRPEHMVKFYQLLGGGLKDAGWMREHQSQNRLAILPNRTHYDMFLAPELAHTALPFLNGDGGAKSWAEQVSVAK